MADIPPDWAIAEAIKRVNATNANGNLWTVKDAKESVSPWARMTRLAASLIAEHEQPPVDPLLKAARRIAYNERRRVNGACDFAVANKILAGEWDDHQLVGAALEGIKRGMELAK